jgi:predicted tellurium resistance membrane protein TerC
LSAVIIADVVMSLDNVIALATTIPLVVSGAALPTALLDRLPMLVYVVAVLRGCCGWITGRSAACR